jgi:Tfp pilus assembly protein FimT
VSKRLKVARKSAKKSRRLAVTIVIIAAMAVIATGAVISRQQVKVKEEASAQAVKTPAMGAVNRNYTTVKVAGQEIQVDSQTGQIRELTPEEAQRLAAGLKRELNKSTDDLVQVQESDGSVSVNIDGRFQNVAVAKTNDDGTITTGCVDNTKAAGEFFGIDPQLMKGQPTGSTTQTGRKQPRTTTPRN